MGIFHVHIAMDPGECDMTIDEYDKECDCDICQQLRKERNAYYAKKHQEQDKGTLKSLHVDENGVEIISEGGFIHRFCIALVDFYEQHGGENYFTTTVDTTVRNKRKRYEITIRNLNGNKSPAETIKELKEELSECRNRFLKMALHEEDMND
jgi:hypothetical protein